MDFFRHDLGTPHRGRIGAYLWVRDTPYTAREKWLSHPFSRKEYERDESKHLYFRWIDDQFTCGNPQCESEDVVCIWYHYDGIDLGVDQTCGEFYCDRCGKYTFVDYYRDSS